VIVATGRLAPQKNFPLLLQAFALLRRQRPARLLILGEGRLRPQLEALIAELGLGEDVALPGFVTNPYAAFARASLFVLSSDYEGLGNVLIEAMACGCPVVSTNCPSGPAEILEGGRLGELVPVKDAAALSAAMLRALDTPRASADALRRRGAYFSQERSAERYLELLFGQQRALRSDGLPAPRRGAEP
jgi:glycosyltransferase involved in cell wall biosynthesis